MIFQPTQLYNAPLDKEKSKKAVQKTLIKRKLKKVIFISPINEENAQNLKEYFFKLMPENWVFKNSLFIDDELKGYVWELGLKNK